MPSTKLEERFMTLILELEVVNFSCIYTGREKVDKLRETEFLSCGSNSAITCCRRDGTGLVESSRKTGTVSVPHYGCWQQGPHRQAMKEMLIGSSE